MYNVGIANIGMGQEVAMAENAQDVELLIKSTQRVAEIFSISRFFKRLIYFFAI
jgi:hypothetical protein